MDSKHQLWTPKNKPLSSLTFDDVKLTDDELKGDIDSIFVALHLFMNSRMVEAEEICMSASDHRLYYSVGFALIQSIKSLATFEPEDLEAAISCCKDSLTITSLLRKKNHSLFESGLRLAKGSTSVSNIASMTLVQRHAELVWAECTLLRAVLGIIYSVLKEALNMRNAYAIYRTLAKFVAQADAAYDGEEDPSIDQHFRSGVFLGNGLISLILSLLPSTVLKIMEVFGFTGKPLSLAFLRG
ncbi:outer membrane protein, IML2, mitochondrial/Tetratricopeptide repeat protein 39 [Pseudohyphozyma bogoriensis]|nr:outer membrane protein, IML2, mitochondrial/Tetratricopeptide repeat protein 39 [Pseudohyphozyma bogoriensis]